MHFYLSLWQLLDLHSFRSSQDKYSVISIWQTSDLQSDFRTICSATYDSGFQFILWDTDQMLRQSQSQQTVGRKTKVEQNRNALRPGSAHHTLSVSMLYIFVTAAGLRRLFFFSQVSWWFVCQGWKKHAWQANNSWHPDRTYRTQQGLWVNTNELLFFRAESQTVRHNVPVAAEHQFKYLRRAAARLFNRSK